MKLFKFTLIVLVLPFQVFAQRTVCTITLNSEHERRIFKNKYSKENIKFVELTDFKKDSKSDTEWFDNACKSGVKCDSLIVSGHFGGTFFGEDTNLTLPLKTLEQKACSKNCEGILSHPKEVYLFGCNTLADKRSDARTPEQYRQVLLNDGIADEYVDQIVASRYSPVGESFKTTMQKVFAGVPQIYGFDSIGPSGKTVSSFLNSYLSKIPSYETRLNQLEGAKVVSQIESASKVTAQFSAPWNSSMKGTAFASCTGAAPGPRKECGLFDESKSDFEKLLIVESLLNGADRKNHFLAIEEYFKGKDLSKLKDNEKQILNRISGNKQAAQELQSLLPQLNSVLETKFPMMHLAERLGWMDEKSLNQEYERSLNAAFKNGLSGAKVAALCSIENPPQFSASQTKPEWFKNEKFLTVLGCWQGSERTALPPHYATEVAKHLSNKNPENITTAIGLLSSNSKADPNLQIKLAELLYSEDVSVAASAMTSLSAVKNPDSRAVATIAKGLSSSNPAEQKRCAYTIRNMKIQDPELKRRALEIDPTMQPW